MKRQPKLKFHEHRLIPCSIIGKILVYYEFLPLNWKILHNSRNKCKQSKSKSSILLKHCENWQTLKRNTKWCIVTEFQSIGFIQKKKISILKFKESSILQKIHELNFSFNAVYAYIQCNIIHNKKYFLKQINRRQ